MAYCVSVASDCVSPMRSKLSPWVSMQDNEGQEHPPPEVVPVESPREAVVARSSEDGGGGSDRCTGIHCGGATRGRDTIPFSRQRRDGGIL